MIDKQKRGTKRYCHYLLGTVAAGLLWLFAAGPAMAADATQKIQPVVITTEASIKKTGTFAQNLDVFIVPVAAIGSGKCKATLALAEPLDGEVISLVCWGVCCGPYSVFDYKTAASQYSVSTTVTVETWGVFFVVATIAGPAENFPKKGSVTVQF
jgi:hypothetical protein